MNAEEVEKSSAQLAVHTALESKEPIQTAALSPPTTKAATQPEAVAGAGPWYIQVGVFSSSKNAEQLRALAKINGWDVSVHTVVDGAKLITKLLVGPYDSKDAATGAIGNVAKDLKISDMYVTQANL